MTVFVVGSINLDLIARVPRLPSPGETLTGLSFETAPGGKGANQALAARRAGSDVAIFGAVGGDSNAGPALELLARESINLDKVANLGATINTGVAMILVDDVSGENEIVVIPGANHALKAELANSLPATSNWVVLLQMEVPSAVNMAVLKHAKTAGARSLLNIAPYDPEVIDLVMQVDVTIANETEFDQLARGMDLSGANRHEQAMAFVDKTGRTIVVTLGGEGAFAATRSSIVSVSSPTIKPIDTVGAGDTFCGYLATGLYEGMSLQQAMDMACHAGALACLKPSAQPSIPYRESVRSFFG